MSIIYDNEVFLKFKALSIQSVNEIEVGMTLYSNCYSPDSATMCLSGVYDGDLIHRLHDMMRDVRILMRTHQPVINAEAVK